MKNKQKKLSAGFTLVELIIYCGLFLIFLTMLTSIFISTLEVHSQAYSRSIVQQDGQFIIQRFIYDINRADSVTTPVNLGETANSLVLDIDGETYSYVLNSGQLELTNNDGTYVINFDQTQISNLSFTKLGNPSGISTVQVDFKVNSKIPDVSGVKEQDFHTTVGLR